MELNYTSEYEKFEAQEGDYGITGNKVSIAGDFQSIECGQVTKEQEFLGTFFAKQADGVWIISLYEMAVAEAKAVIPIIEDVIKELSK